MSMRSIRSELDGSLFPLKLGVSSLPAWKRRVMTPQSYPGGRMRRSEQVEAESVRRLELVKAPADHGES